MWILRLKLNPSRKCMEISLENLYVDIVAYRYMLFYRVLVIYFGNFLLLYRLQWSVQKKNW